MNRDKRIPNRRPGISFTPEEVRRLISHLEMVTDDGPPGMGWKSDELESLIGLLYQKLEDADNEPT